MLTPRRKLRAGESYWSSRKAASPRIRESPPRRFYDVAVIGAGISGALTAHALAMDGVDVLVIDRRHPAAGSTSASTALIQWEIDEPLTRLKEKVGRAKASLSYRASYAAVQALRRLIVNHGLKAGMAPRSTLLLAGGQMDPTALQAEAKARQALGLPSHFAGQKILCSRHGFDREGALVSRGGLELDPRALTFQLFRRAQQLGADIVSPISVESLSSCAGGVFLGLSDGTTVACRKVIAATGYEVLPELPKDGYKLVSTWALATVPQPASALWPGRSLVWEASDPYLYFRTTPDRRIIAGGEDEPFSSPQKRDALCGRKAKAILAKLKPLLPHAQLDADFVWSGTFAESPTGLPMIGPVKVLDNVFAILGAGGNGITYSVIAASLAKAWVRGRRHPLSRLFSP